MRLDDMLIGVTPTLIAAAKLPHELPFKEVADFGSTVLVAALLVWFVVRYMPNERASRDAMAKAFQEAIDRKDKAFWEMVEKVRTEDFARRTELAKSVLEELREIRRAVNKGREHEEPSDP